MTSNGESKSDTSNTALGRRSLSSKSRLGGMAQNSARLSHTVKSLKQESGWLRAPSPTQRLPTANVFSCETPHGQVDLDCGPGTLNDNSYQILRSTSSEMKSEQGRRAVSSEDVYVHQTQAQPVLAHRQPDPQLPASHESHLGPQMPGGIHDETETFRFPTKGWKLSSEGLPDSTNGRHTPGVSPAWALADDYKSERGPLPPPALSSYSQPVSARTSRPGSVMPLPMKAQRKVSGVQSQQGLIGLGINREASERTWGNWIWTALRMLGILIAVCSLIFTVWDCVDSLRGDWLLNWYVQRAFKRAAAEVSENNALLLMSISNNLR